MRISATPTVSFKGNIIDSHAHLGLWDGKNYQPQNLTDIAKDTFEITVDGKKQTDEIECFLISNTNCLRKDNGIFAKNEIDGNKEMLEFCKQNSKFKAEAVCQPGAGNADNIDKLLTENGKDIYALKFHPMNLGKDANDAVYEPYLKVAEKHNKPCVFHSDHIGSFADPYKIYDSAKKTPNVPVVLYHMSMQPYGNLNEKPELAKQKKLESSQGSFWDHREKWNQDGIDVVKKAVKENKDANMYLEVSWTKPETVVKAIKEVGEDRVLFGTDAPLGEMGKVVDYHNRVAEVKTSIKKEFGDKAEGIINKVFFENSNKLFFNSQLKMTVGGQEINPTPKSVPVPKTKGKYALPIAIGVLVCGGIGALLYPRKSRNAHSQSDQFVRSNKK